MVYLIASIAILGHLFPIWLKFKGGKGVATYIGYTFAIDYIFGLILLGVGWNFLFISGTSLLIISYKHDERFKVQGLNDFLVFSTQAIGALAAGYMLYITNWELINILCLPLLLFLLITTFYTKKITKK